MKRPHGRKLAARQRIRIAFRTFKRLSEFLAFGLYDTIVLAGVPEPRGGRQGVAIVQLKRLGDYFLWLPYGLAIVKHLEAQGQRVRLIANATWSEQARSDFPGCAIDPVDPRRLVRHWRYRRRTLRALRQHAVALTVQAGYLRDFIIDDAIVRALGGETLGFDAVYRDHQAIERLWTPRLYRRLVTTMPGAHEQCSYRKLVEVLGGTAVAGANPLRPEVPEDLLPHPAPYFVLAPGASRDLKRWPVERFVALAGRVLDAQPAWRLVVAGTGQESALGEAIVRALGPRAQNRSGLTGLVEFLALVRGARLVIGNDSAAGHVAARYGVPSVIALGGMDFGHAYPYDPACAEVQQVPRPVSSPMDCFGCDGFCRYKVAPGRCAPCLEAVSVEAMWQALESALAASGGS